MMIRVIKAFDFYHNGIHPTRYQEGEQPVPTDAARVALAEGWAVEIEQSPKAEMPTQKKSRNKKRAG